MSCLGPPGRARRPLVAVLALLAASCLSSPERYANEYAQILQLEGRRFGEKLSVYRGFLEHEDAWVRSRATRAIGRLARGEGTALLCRQLGDASRIVRIEAAFALGQITDPSARREAKGALVPLLDTSDAELRKTVVLALSKISNRSIQSELAERLRDEDPGVRGAAALALHRLRVRSMREHAGRESSEDLDRAMLSRLLAALEGEENAEVVWRFVYAIAGLRSRQARAALVAQSTHPESAIVRVFAIRGLGELARARRSELEESELSELSEVLRNALSDADPRVAIEAAVALGDPSPGGQDGAPREALPVFQTPLELEALVARVTDSNPHLAAAAVRGIGHYHHLAERARQALSLAEASPNATVKVAAILASARLLGEDYAGILKHHAGSSDWRLRKATARALRHVDSRSAVALGRRLLADPDLRVRIEALGALADHGDNRGALEIAAEALDFEDPAVREAAASTLDRIGDASVLKVLRRNYVTSKGADFADARLQIVRTVGRIGRGREDTRSFLTDALRDEEPDVQRAAVKALEAFADGKPVPRPRFDDKIYQVPLPGKQFAPGFPLETPRVELETDKGKIVIELWPSVAPVHCYNLLAYVGAKAYDGRIFHRVVPNFVVQGGDARGDGYGSKAFLGGRLRDEINPRPFLAGTLGMPKSSEPDSGGEQIFITILPTPHLDGRYTAFGRVVEGIDVLLALEVGDTIRSARAPGG